MPLSVKGYVLEPPRVGASNSPFTLTPNNLISNQSAFDTAYPSDESKPRTEYCVFVQRDTVTPGTGPNLGRSLADARFIWTKNEEIQRFDYSGRDGRFKPLAGAPSVILGTLRPDANVNRYKVDIPVSQNLAVCPIRIGLGYDLNGHDDTFPITLVAQDSLFSSPAIGSVQLSLETGNLNWNDLDIQDEFAGANIRYHRQLYYSPSESTGLLGNATSALWLSPLPAPTQVPLIRIGFGSYLTPVPVNNDSLFSPNPTAGTVQWSIASGRLKFNSAVVSDIYYDGTAFEFNKAVSVVSIGTVNTPSNLNPIPKEDSDLFFRVSGVVQFAETQFVDALTSPGKKGVVQVLRTNGAVRFSDADKNSYGPYAVQAVIPDMTIERGMSLRLFRSPVNAEATDPDLKDVTALYVVEDATLANPIIGAPTVTLPSIPLDTSPITVSVTQGTGSFVGPLPRLDVATPPTGVGYVFNFDKRELMFAQRMATQILDAPVPYGGAKLPNELVLNSNFELALETLPNSGTFSPLVIGQDALIDYSAGMVTMVTTDGVSIMSGSLGVISGSTFTEAGKNFISVPSGSQLVVTNGLSEGIYNVVSSTATVLNLDVTALAFESGLTYEIREPAEILADRYFYSVPIVDPTTKIEKLRFVSAVKNTPRIKVDISTTTRIRIGLNYAIINRVVNDSMFSDPSVLNQGSLEMSESTGNLNFSNADINAACFVATLLRPSIDYVLQEVLGFVQLSERLLEGDEILVTYKDSDLNVINEQAAFLISKETINHPVPASTLPFNDEGKIVASNPSPRVFRGGRPQNSSQVMFDVNVSTVTFIAPNTVTDALPSGPIIDPSERILIDYYIYNALGGEQSFTVLKPPMATSKLVITDGVSSFTLEGDYTSSFISGSLLLVESKEVYAIQSSTYSGGKTTVTLVIGQSFRNDYTNPKVAASSGVITDAYFLTEAATREVVPRGMNRFKVSGDVSRRYVEGTIVTFTDGTSKDYYYVSGSTYSSETDMSTIVLMSNTIRQYALFATLKRSIRPVLMGAPSKVSTSNSVVLDKTYQVFRKTEGAVGVFLRQPEEYSIDASGAITLVEPLKVGESVQIFYTGNTVISQGRRLRTTYTCTIVPTASNGLLNQVLKMSYSTYQPDSFFWRVETMTNFRGELAEDYEAEATSGSTSGPMLSNLGGTKLYKQGRESVFFQEGYLTNEDLVARGTLKFYNDVIGSTEALLKGLDGRVVGDHDGPFLFDGVVDNPSRTSFATVTNQIDDRFQISPAPYSVTGPPFVATSIGTYKEVYKPSLYSRFYPTTKKCFGVVIAASNAGDPILDLGVTKLTSVSGVTRRSPWAVVTAAANIGATTLNVDDANGSSTLLRPAFVVGMKVAIISQTGTVLVSDGSSLTISSVSAGSIGLTALPVAIPVGATVRLATNDTVYAKSYRLGVDFGVDLERGLLTYLGPTSFWAGLTDPPSVPSAGEILDVDVFYNNPLTEPYRFPALDGQPLDDDGNRQFPILSPSTVYEPPLIDVMENIVKPSTGTLRALVSAPYTGTGNLDGTGTIITNVAGNWVSPLPLLYDLVDIKSGANSPSTYRRVVAVGANTITVDSAFPVPNATGFLFAVTSATPLVTGTATAGSTTTLTDSGANFSTVVPGHTLVITSGANLGRRRQIVTVPSTTALTCEAFPSAIAVGTTYRIVNTVTSYGKVSASLTQTSLIPNIDSQNSVVASEIGASDTILSEAMDVKTGGLNGQTSAAILTATGQTFLSSGVNNTYFVYMRSGINAGIYPIQSVLTETTLQIVGSFPSPQVGLAYNIMRPMGVSLDYLTKVLGVALNGDTRLNQLISFKSVLTTTVAVTGDAGAYATRLLTTTLDTANSNLLAREAQIPGAIDDMSSNLASGDRLYDSRFVWIDARINLEKGTLPMRELAVEQRNKKLAQIKNQMVKILSVET